MFNLNTNNVLRHAARASQAQLNLASTPKPVRQIDETEHPFDGWWNYLNGATRYIEH
jgi:hypothetical protein